MVSAEIEKKAEDIEQLMEPEKPTGTENKKKYSEKKEKSIRRLAFESRIKGIALVVVSVLLVLSLLGNITFFGSSNNQVTGKLIGNSIAQISELATLEYNYSCVGEFSDSRILDFSFIEIPVPFTEKHFIGSFDGIIKYGVDLSKIGELVIDDEKKEISIEMPEILQLSHEIDDNSLKYFDQDNNLFNPIKVEDADLFRMENKDDTEKKAIENGIIPRVQEHTENAIEAFLHNLYPDYAEYQVICTFPEQTDIREGTISGVEV